MYIDIYNIYSNRCPGLCIEFCLCCAVANSFESLAFFSELIKQFKNHLIERESILLYTTDTMHRYESKC